MALACRSVMEEPVPAPRSQQLELAAAAHRSPEKEEAHTSRPSAMAAAMALMTPKSVAAQAKGMAREQSWLAVRMRHSGWKAQQVVAPTT